jgi:hypothetical protein
MEWITIGLWVAAALILWFVWQTYLEQQVRERRCRGCPLWHKALAKPSW